MIEIESEARENYTKTEAERGYIVSNSFLQNWSLKIENDGEAKKAIYLCGTDV